MRVIKPQRLGLLTKTMPHEGAGLFVVSTFSMFDLLNPDDILAETAMWPLVAKELPEGAVFDASYPKPRGEFLIAGKAMSGEAVRALHVAVSVGDLGRYLSVFGDRYWETGPEGPTFSEPVPFTEMPLTPGRAFGGDGFAPNPAGQGAHALELGGAIPHLPLPNVEIAGSEIVSIADRPAPALVGPIALDDPARIALAGTYDKGWVEHRMPDWPTDFNPQFFMAAPAGQQAKSYFTGDEPIRVVGMSARHPDIQSHLPGLRARTFVRSASSQAGLSEVRMHTDTVWIFGSELKGVVVHRGVIPVNDRDGRDITDVMIGYERIRHEPKPADHYREVFRLRTEPDEAHKYLLADGQLSPSETPEEIERREQDRREAAEARQTKWTESRQWRLERLFSEQGLPTTLVPAIEEPEIKPLALPSKDDIERGDVDIARLMSDVEDLRREAELKSDMANAEIFGLVKQIGVTPPNVPPASLDEMEALGHGASTEKGYLPSFEKLLPQQTLDQILQDFENAPKSALEAPPEPDPALVFEKAKARFLKEPSGGLLSSAKNLMDTVPASPFSEAHEGQLASASVVNTDEPVKSENAALDDFLARAFPAAVNSDEGSPIDTLTAAITGNSSSSPAAGEVIGSAQGQLNVAENGLEGALATARRTAVEAIAPLEPVGSEAAGLLGSFVRSFLEEGGSIAGRDLAGAQIAGLGLNDADLTGGFLERCDLTGSPMRRAICKQAVFTGAYLAGVDCTKADFSGANLSGVHAAKAAFEHALLKDMTVFKADFSECDFAGATFENCTFVDCSFSNTRFAGSILKDCSFLQSDLNAVRFDNANLEKTSFLSCTLDRSNWSGAALTKVSFAEVSFKSAAVEKAHLEECGWFGGTDMHGTNFSHARAFKCGFQDAVLRETAFVGAIFEECNLAGTDLELADMRLSSWRGSLFAFSRIRRADLFGANLRNASLHAADLTQSSLRAANFHQTDLSEAVLAFADLTRSNLHFTNMEARP
ncbi:DUF2169 domain-containing protein [uncultured Roseibium sp.]|uniref:DUF2169 domain-containing protein n=1 Tax=uncultured Roseibium sp. TaxID=1936171 RepID=UPI00260443D6|nr:DUF2169 domain-containing protein [uncultured Roseibium sp.]